MSSILFIFLNQFGGQAPIVSAVVGLLDNLSCGVLLKGRLYAKIRPSIRG